jgi:alpha-beta hydrolase superfamily lysophospholipase
MGIDMTPTHWTPDILSGFEQFRLTGMTASDGPPDPVLVRKRCHQPSARAVLYLHGYTDYFFQSHLADFYNRQGLHFYAVDMRRHGRSIKTQQLPNYTADIDEYLEDVDAAISQLQASEGIDWLLLNGHSTGGLVAALYAHRGRQRGGIKAVFLNSPFFAMNLLPWQAKYAVPLLAAMGKVFPQLPTPPLTALYGQSLHVSQHGQWQYNTQWKPIRGFPVLAGWLRAIHHAQRELAKGLNLGCPVLLLHAGRSTWPTRFGPAAMTSDIVLNVQDMVRLAPRLGQRVTVHAIEDGIHDLCLSQPVPRQAFFDALQDWLDPLVANPTGAEFGTLHLNPTSTRP